LANGLNFFSPLRHESGQSLRFINHPAAIYL